MTGVVFVLWKWLFALSVGSIVGVAVNFLIEDNSAWMKVAFFEVKKLSILS